MAMMKDYLEDLLEDYANFGAIAATAELHSTLYRYATDNLSAVRAELDRLGFDVKELA
jgi:hypothetical protein